MTRAARLTTVLGLNVALVVALVLVGRAAHSVAVVAEGADYLADAAAIAVALAALRLRDRHRHALHVAALVNAGWLLVLTIAVVVAAALRLAGGVQEVHGVPVLVASAVAGAAMLAGALVLGGDVDDDDDDDDGGGARLAMRAVLLDTAADAAAAGAVAVTGAVIALSGGLQWLDPAVAIAVSLVIAYHAVRLLAEIVLPRRGGQRRAAR